MTRTVTLLGYTVLAAVMIGHQAFGLLSGRTATLGQAVARLRRSRVGRPLLLAAWLWLGWHLFVRGTYQ